MLTKYARSFRHMYVRMYVKLRKVNVERGDRGAMRLWRKSNSGAHRVSRCISTLEFCSSVARGSALRKSRRKKRAREVEGTGTGTGRCFERRCRRVEAA